MRLLFNLDRKDYGQCTRTYVRDSARSIIISGSRIAMVHSLKYDYYKFPGGGIKDGEDPADAMIRETMEEAGLKVCPETVQEYGLVHRIQKSKVDETECFVQNNYYYLCEVSDTVEPQHLDDYEAEERFTLEYIEPQMAIETNRRTDHGPKDAVMLEREARVLEMLMDEGFFGLSPESLSTNYLVRELTTADIPHIFALCSGNEQYYQYCPPQVTEQSIAADMEALPPGKEKQDKYYVGFYDGERLIAVLDLILAYPNPETAYIGFFMVEKTMQGAGVGSKIVDEICEYLSRNGFSRVRLGWAEGNLQAEQFWRKNGFRETGVTYNGDDYTVIIAQRDI